MVRFTSTRHSIEQLNANIPKKAGLHYLRQPTVAVGGLDLGTQDFDPARHKAHQIDPLSFEAAVSGIDQVRVQFPANPLQVSIVADYRHAKEDVRLSTAKDTAIATIVAGVQDAVPNMDREFVYRVDGDISDEEQLASDNAQILRLCSSGLCFLIGDMSQLALPARFSARSSVIGLKVNHPAELEIPANVGYLPLGGRVEVNTNDPRQLEVVNSRLFARHTDTMERIAGYGALVDSIVVDPLAEAMVDVAATDTAIANLVSSLR